MKSLKALGLTALFLSTLGISTMGCKSKLEKCNGVCDKILAEDEARCGSDDSCLANARAKNASCKGLCNDAVGDGKQHSDARPSKSREERCEADDAKACMEVALQHLKGRDGKTKSDALAARYLKKACDAGEMFGCESYGKMLRDGRGVGPDHERALTFLEKACSGKSYGACSSLGLDALEAGDKKRAHSLFTKACDGEDEIGCVGLAAMYLHGNGVAKNVDKAKSILDKACRLGSTRACDKAKSI